MDLPENSGIVQSIRWKDGKAILIDQTRLPNETVFLELESPEGIHEAIQNLRIRGAPAIGIAAAYGLYLGIRSVDTQSFSDFWSHVQSTADYLASARPTAVNLQWALDRITEGVREQNDQPIADIKQWVLQEARDIHTHDKQICKSIGETGASLIPRNANVLTHCNTGSLATGLYGTALSVIYHAHTDGKNPHIWVDETRPLLQGARLTTWELMRADIPCTLITDSTAGSLMQQGNVDVVVVGTDRVAANGDVANKIGTYPLAVLADQHQIPFYVAAPLSSIDTAIETGEQIPIEERSGQEITHIGDTQIAPDKVKTYTPAFDVTPHTYVSGFITEDGVVNENYGTNLRQLKEEKNKKPDLSIQ